MENLRVAIGDTWQPRALPYLSMVMMALMLITNVLNLKFINFFGFSIISSQISYVLSLILADILAEVYGYRRVRKLLYVGLCCLVLYAGFVQFAVWLPPAKDFSGNQAFHDVFWQAPRVVAASVAAYFVTELVNSFVMSRLKVRLRARFFYLRAIAAVGTAQVVNGATFWTIAFAGTLPLRLILSAASFAWAVVMICELIVLPVTRQLALAVKRYEGVEHFDAAPADESS
jgi:uncharacterized integral membrane protein (TIGR00697 family)